MHPRYSTPTISVYLNNGFSQILASLYQRSDVFLHEKSKNPRYFQALLKIEAQDSWPLSAMHPDFVKLDTDWIYQPGIHLVIDRETKAFVFGALIECVLH